MLCGQNEQFATCCPVNLNGRAVVKMSVLYVWRSQNEGVTTSYLDKAAARDGDTIEFGTGIGSE